MVMSAGREAKRTFPVEIVGDDCLAISVVNPVALCSALKRKVRKVNSVGLCCASGK